VIAVLKSELVEKAEMETKRTKRGKIAKGRIFWAFCVLLLLVLFVSTLISLKEADFRADFRSVYGLIEQG
jgi:hypothetical protein